MKLLVRTWGPHNTNGKFTTLTLDQFFLSSLLKSVTCIVHSQKDKNVLEGYSFVYGRPLNIVVHTPVDKYEPYGSSHTGNNWEVVLADTLYFPKHTSNAQELS